MVDAVGSIAGGGVVAPIGTQNLVASATTTATQQAAQSLGQGQSAATLSHRLYDDPTTGVLVNDQIDSKGHVVSQTPSGFVLAYLRNGLTADGLPKQAITA